MERPARPRENPADFEGCRPRFRDVQTGRSAPPKGALVTSRPLAVFTVLLLLILVALDSPPVQANTGCPESTTSFGNQTLTGDCTITTATTWENGTITITGNIIVDEPLTLRDVTIVFNPSFEGQYELIVWDALDMQGGGIQSANAFHWRVEVLSSPSVYIANGSFNRGTWDLGGAPGAIVENNVFANVDTSHVVPGQHMWVARDSIIRNNLLDDISLYSGAALVSYNSYGNTLYENNTLRLRCFGANCMGIEVYGSHPDIVSGGIFPGFPVIEIRQNTIIWEEIGSGTDSGALDNEYSYRIYAHNNTQYVNPDGLAPGESVTQPLEMGGTIDSVFENNTFFGPSNWGIYNYIYGNAGNLIQYNFFGDVRYGGIFQTGGSTIRYNTFTGIVRAGIHICPNTPCAGSSAATADMEFYGNTFNFEPGAYIVRTDEGNMFDNTFIGHGNGEVAEWEGSGATYHTVYGEGNWLYWAKQDIERLEFVNTTGGTRYVNMTVGGVVYPSSYPGFGTTDDASLTIAGAIDRTGSSNHDDTQTSTVLWSLSPDKTEVDVVGTGSLAFTVDNFAVAWSYDVSIWDYGLSQFTNQAFTTDSGGQGTFNIASAGHYKVTIDATGAPPPPPDGTAPAQVTDLNAAGVGSDYAVLQWTAPGDDGNLGQAASYDIRYSTAGPLDGANFASATPVPVGVPTPGTSGSTETLNVTGLAPGTDYWFAIRTADEVPNLSPVSNSVNITTSPSPDVSSPAQVTDLQAVAVNNNYVILQWSAPGDDGNTGQADAYDTRYSLTGPVDELNFLNATPVPVSAPAPTSAGGIERLNVTGLSPATDYWFALRTADEVPNWSLVSNSVNTTTLQNATDVDDTPPMVRITSPEQDSVVSGIVVVMVEASDDTSVEEAVILLDGSLAATLSEAPYLWAWSTASASLGWHTLQARATDPAGNVGESAEVGVVVLPAGITPESLRPTVDSVRYDPSEGRIDIRFSRPMDRPSLEQALSIEPEIVHQTAWEDDSNLAVTLQEGAQPDVMYTLTIAASAADVNGTTLGKAFIFGFRGGAAPMDSGVVPDLWLRVSLLLTVGLIGVVGLHLWGRRKVQRVRLKMRQLTSRLEDLDSASQARIHRELADLEDLLEESATARGGRAPRLLRPR